MKVIFDHPRRRSIFVAILLICVCSVLIFTRLCFETAILSGTNLARSSKPPVKLFKIVIGTTGRSFQVYDGLHVFLVSDHNYTWGGEIYPRTCDKWATKCQMKDWITMMKLVLETKVFEKTDYVWILEDDTYPCPGADALLKRILMGNPAIQMLNTGIGASGWVLRESAFRDVLDLLVTKQPDGPDLGVANDMRPLPTRLAVNFMTHTTLQKSTLGHVHVSPIYAGCFEYQTVSGWCNYDLFDWNVCAGYDLYPCPEGTTTILSELQIGYVGNTYKERESNEGLKTWIVKSSLSGTNYLHSEASPSFPASSLNN
ncbi:unnamed protein product [Calypogeia fissa]